MRLRESSRPLVASLAAALVLSGCGSDGGAGGDDTIVIGWSPPDVTGVFQTATQYFEQAAEEAGKAGIEVEVETRSPASHTDYGDQVAIIEDFVTRDVDVIAISPTDTETIKPAIRQANEAGIPVIYVNLLEEQSDVEVASYIGFDNTVAAKVSGYAMLDYFGGPGVLGAGPKAELPDNGMLDIEWWEQTYDGADLAGVTADGVIIEGISGTLFSRNRVDGFTEVADTASGVEVVAEPIAADWNREKGTSAAETFLGRFGAGELNFIYAASNEMALGAVAVAQQRDRLDSSGGTTPPAADKVAIFTNDVTPESADAIRDGSIVAETTHGFAEWGWYGTEFGVRLACGLDVPELQDIRPRTVYADNVDEFYPDPQLPEIDWESIAAECER
jgi:ribose transport system substrate-binding protein